MDLDSIKDIWTKTDLTVRVEEGRFEKILSGKVRNALDRLMIFEKTSMYIAIVLTCMPWLHNYLFSIAQYSLFSKIWFTGFCIIFFFWEIVKIKLLKKIDIEKTDILSSLKYITRYKKYIQYELLIAITWFFIFIFSFVYPLLVFIPDDKYATFFSLVAISIIVSIIAVVLLYRIIYIRNIRKIEDSISEINDFEKEN